MQTVNSKITKHFYSIACIFFVLAFFFGNLTGVYSSGKVLPFLFTLNRIFRLIGYGLFTCKLVVQYKTGILNWFIFFAACFFAGISILINSNFIVIDALLLVFASKDEAFDRNYKFILSATMLCLATIFLLFSFSIIPQYIIDIENSSRGWRYSLGLGHPNYLGFFAMYFIWAIIYFKYKTLRLHHCLIILTLTVVMYAISKSRGAFLGIAVTAIFTVFCKMFKTQKLKDAFSKIFVGLPFYCCFFTFASVFFYRTNSKLAPIVNKFFSGRLWIFSHYLDNTPFNLFGTSPEGNPLLLSERRGRLMPMPLDNVYLRVYINFGLVFLLIFLSVWVFALKRAYLKGNMPLLIIGLATAIYGIVEPIQSNFIFSPIMLSAFALYDGENDILKIAAKEYKFFELFSPKTWKKTYE